jgi:hypothetical protein
MATAVMRSSRPMTPRRIVYPAFGLSPRIHLVPR